MEPEHNRSLEAVVADARAAVLYLAQDVSELRLESRKILVIQLATLATALGSLVAALVTATR
jgi:hypothetical protein